MSVFGNFVVGGNAFDVDVFLDAAALVVFGEEVGEAFMHVFDVGVGEDGFCGRQGVFVGLAHAFFAFVECDLGLGAFGVFEGD